MGQGDVAGRNRTCGASRFRRPLYRAELRPRVSGQGWTRTSSLLFVRQALCAIELLAHAGLTRWGDPVLRDKDSNLDLRVQSAVSWPLDDPGMKQSVVHATRPRFDPGSLRSYRYRASSWRRSGARRSLSCRNSQAKAAVELTASITALSAGEDLSLSGGASIWFSVFFKLGITSLDSSVPSNDEGDPFGSPSLRAAMPLHV